MSHKEKQMTPRPITECPTTITINSLPLINAPGPSAERPATRFTTTLVTFENKLVSRSAFNRIPSNPTKRIAIVSHVIMILPS
jgi:hypothetical protein